MSTPDPDSLTLISTLTPRERDVLIFVSKGETRDRTAKLLGIGRTTVESHIKRIHAKLDVETTIESAVIAAKAGIV